MNKRADIDPNKIIQVEDLSEPLTYSVEAFTSPEYAQDERDRLWSKVWQHAGRVEEIPEVGNFITYDIMDESIGFQTEFEFDLPKGYVDGDGVLHRHGVMRLATAADEVLPLRDQRVLQNPGYLTIIILSRR